MTTPRILFLDHTGVLGGAELSLLDVAAHFRDDAHVTLFEQGPFLEALAQSGVAADVVPMPPKMAALGRTGGLRQDVAVLPSLLRHARRLARRARNFDLLYANSQKAMVAAALAGALARRPVLWHLRDVMTAAHFGRLHRLAAITCADLLVDRVIANSEATRTAFVRGGGLASRTFTVHNGIDPAPFLEDPGDRAATRRELSLYDRPAVGLFGRLAAWKGQHVLLDALRYLPGVHALVVGDALFTGDVAYARTLYRQADAPELRGRIHFLGFRRDVPRLLRAVDVVVHASTAPEPFGRVIVEGMLAARPVVATDGGGAAEILDQGRTGHLVPAGDARMLAQKLATLLADPAAAHTLARACRAEARRRFSLDAMLCALERHVRAVAAPHAARRIAMEARPA